MRILIYDNNIKDLENLCQMIKHLPIDILIDKISYIEEFYTLYNSKEYDTVIVDTNDTDGTKIVEHITNIKPKQKIIVINNQFFCTEEKGCDYCKSHYNKHRIVKPLDTMDIVRAIKDATPCDFDYCEDHLLMKLVIISKPLYYLDFDKDRLRFDFGKSNSNLVTKDIINLSLKLIQYGIKYNTNEDNIQIL